ncbi:MAG: NAD(P)-dependent oxidoreductase [Nocardioidaceae bacterium]
MNDRPTVAPTVALLGTGLMGAGMARNIAGAGLELRVWNRSTDKAAPLADAGATVAATPAEAVEGADVVVTMLFDTDSVTATMREAAPGLSADAVWLQMATVGIAGTDTLAGLARELGVAFVDAPVLGTRKPAEDGTLVVLASGPEQARTAVDPVIEAVSARVMWLGEAGQGTRLKLVANSWVLTVVEGVAESLALAKALGLDPQSFLDVVKGGAMDAPYVQLKGGAMLAGEFEPSFGLDGAAKDARLIVEAARGAGADLAVLEAVQAHFARALEAGHGDQDLAATYLEH